MLVCFTANDTIFSHIDWHSSSSSSSNTVADAPPFRFLCHFFRISRSVTILKVANYVHTHTWTRIHKGRKFELTCVYYIHTQVRYTRPPSSAHLPKYKTMTAILMVPGDSINKLKYAELNRFYFAFFSRSAQFRCCCCWPLLALSFLRRIIVDKDIACAIIRR